MDDDSFLDYEYGLYYLKDICISSIPAILNLDIKLKEVRKILKDLTYAREENQI